MYQNFLNSMVIGNLDNYAVNGMKGVEAFQTQPNQRYCLFDKMDDVEYFFTTDVNNIKSPVRRVRFTDEPEPTLESQFVSVTEFNELKGEINNVQQSIQQLIELQSRQQPIASGQHGDNKGSSNRNQR